MIIIESHQILAPVLAVAIDGVEHILGSAEADIEVGKSRHNPFARRRHPLIVGPNAVPIFHGILIVLGHFQGNIAFSVFPGMNHLLIFRLRLLDLTGTDPQVEMPAGAQDKARFRMVEFIPKIGDGHPLPSRCHRKGPDRRKKKGRIKIGASRIHQCLPCLDTLFQAFQLRPVLQSLLHIFFLPRKLPPVGGQFFAVQAKFLSLTQPDTLFECQIG